MGRGVDNGPGHGMSQGIAGVPFAAADARSATPVTDAPDSGKKLVITDLVVSVDTQMTVTFFIHGTSTVVLGPLYFPANSIVQLCARGKLKVLTANKTLDVQANVTGNISVWSSYYSEP